MALGMVPAVRGKEHRVKAAVFRQRIHVPKLKGWGRCQRAAADSSITFQIIIETYNFRAFMCVLMILEPFAGGLHLALGFA